MNVNITYEEDTDCDGLREEQIYWNANDGELVTILEINEALHEDKSDEVLVLDMHSGASDIWEQEGTIFHDDYVWVDLIPVKYREMETRYDE